MKVKITKPVVLEALSGSIVEISERQYNLIKNYCELHTTETEIETKVVTKAQKTIRKGKK